MMAVDLAIALHERGFRSTVVGLNNGGRLEARLRDAGVPFECLGGVRYLSPGSHLAVLRTLRRLSPNAIHTHHLPSLLNTVLAARTFPASRLVHTEHAHIYLDEEPSRRRLLRWASRGADTVALVGSGLHAYYLNTVGIRADTLRVVPNGVDVHKFTPLSPDGARELRARAGLPTTGTLVGAVGRLADVKNLGLLIRAAVMARSAGLDVKVALVGDGESREDLVNLTRELGVTEQVTFMGWRTDVAELIQAFDILAISSQSEALPLAALEAMSAGVPVLSTAVGDVPRVVAWGRAGVLVPPDDLGAFTQALCELAADPETRRVLAERGRVRVAAEYSRDAMVDAYLSLYGLSVHPV